MKLHATILCLLVTGATLVAQDTPIIPAKALANQWLRKKSLAEPKEETRRTKGIDLEIVEVKVDADSEAAFQNIRFALDSDRLEGGATKQQLAEIAKAMNQAGSETFLIEGHTCDLGGERHNKELSQRRAVAVVAALVNMGVSPARLQPVGFGAEQPLVPNGSEEQRSQNRRVQIFRKL